MKWLFFILSELPAIVFAEGDKLSAPQLAPNVYVETLGGLLLVLALIFVLGWLLKRYGRLPTGGHSQIRVLGGISLGGRERAVLLESEGERILVGVSPGQVRTLHVWQTESKSVDFAQELSEAKGDEITN